MPETRVLLFAGTGGAGVTTLAAATALHAAAGGYRTLLLPLHDPAPLTDILGASVGPDAAPVAERLWARTAAPGAVFAPGDGLGDWIQGLLDRTGPGGLVMDDLALAPGITELAGLLALEAEAATGAYHLIVVDCPPPGLLLRVVALLDALRLAPPAEWSEPESAAVRLARPLLRRLTDLPVPDERVAAGVRALQARLEQARRLITDEQAASVRVVARPSSVSMRAAARIRAALALYEIGCDALLCNAAASAIRATNVALDALPVLTVPALDEEPVGQGPLRRLAGAIYGERDPAALFHRDERPVITAERAGYLLRLPLPAAERDALSLLQTGERVTVGYGRWKRVLLLPPALAGMTCAGAEFDGGRLLLRFSAGG
jgi:arsenite-transporting ATPase